MKIYKIKITFTEEDNPPIVLDYVVDFILEALEDKKMKVVMVASVKDETPEVIDGSK